MKLFTAEQIKRWDAFTIESEGISSFDLMERAANKCVKWLLAKGFAEKTFHIFCGKGNNGGDGLAIARLLHEKDISIHVYILETGNVGTADFQTNLQQLKDLSIAIQYIEIATGFPEINSYSIVIDALFGAGLNKPLSGLSKELIAHINGADATIVSIDLPSGLFLSQSTKGHTAIQATYTLTFQTYKMAFMLAENAAYIGHLQLLDIELSKAFYDTEPSSFQTLDLNFIQSIFRPKNKFSHKGTFGHALLIGGSYGKMGATVLASTSAIRSGCGLVTAYIPKCGYTVMQTVLPEAMTLSDVNEDYITQLPENLESFSSIGIGPGLGTAPETQKVVIELLSSYKDPLVIDADGLNCLAINQEAIEMLPKNTILTPHPKEFERLFGICKNEVERIELAIEKAKAYQIIIILKGHHTLIALPDGTAWFNTTGNAGMAKGGSGDVLTGILTSLLAQGYSAKEASLFGVYLHGLAGDLAAERLSQETMIASDIITFLTAAFRKITMD